jgi:hypothetical protein
VLLPLRAPLLALSREGGAAGFYHPCTHPLPLFSYVWEIQGLAGTPRVCMGNTGLSCVLTLYPFTENKRLTRITRKLLVCTATAELRNS